MDRLEDWLDFFEGTEFIRSFKDSFGGVGLVIGQHKHIT